MSAYTPELGQRSFFFPVSSPKSVFDSAPYSWLSGVSFWNKKGGWVPHCHNPKPVIRDAQSDLLNPPGSGTEFLQTVPAWLSSQTSTSLVSLFGSWKNDLSAKIWGLLLPSVSLFPSFITYKPSGYCNSHGLEVVYTTSPGLNPEESKASSSKAEYECLHYLLLFFADY